MTVRGLRRGWTKLGAVVAVAAMALLTACGGGSTGSTERSELSLVAFSVPKPAYDDAQKAFADTPEGEGTSWKSSYGASGDQARAVISGLPADYVSFSLSSDMTKLVDKQLVAPEWNTGANEGIVSTSVVVIVTRKGNPLGIKGWADLIKPGVKIVTPNPGSSGSARWNILAAWSHITANGGSEQDAIDYLTSYYANIVSLPSSGREATSAFTSGTGDVRISYENEASAARQSGAEVDYVVPETSIKIENPGAVTTKAPESAKKFLGFVTSDAGQTIFAEHGFRPLNASIKPAEVKGANDPSDPFPTVQKLATIDDLGGWSEVSKKFFDEENGIVTKVQDASGVA